MTVELRCAGCDRPPSEIGEFVAAALDETTDEVPVTPEEYVWEEEGTLNTSTGQFLCTACYIRAGMPEAPQGWKVPQGWRAPWDA